MSEDDEDGFELLVPFVACDDHGGPFAANAYIAGFEMGQFWQICATMQACGRPSQRTTIRRDNKAQADLIAMHHEMECLEEPELNDNSEWVQIIFGYDIVDDVDD